MSILETINSSADVKKLRSEELAPLCAELRDTLVETVSKTGGHFASNLGVVELTVALHRVYDSSRDRLVFDVGHQCYVHKLLTGRRDRFATLRRLGGLSGFPKPYEAEDDAFIAGHSSNSISVALGMARARTVMHKDYDVVAVIGDGAMTGGLAYEGLSNAAASGEPLLIILNDNNMSIDRNVGGMDSLLQRMRFTAGYLRFKKAYRAAFEHLPALYRFNHRIKERVKDWLLPDNIFTEMGMNYLGPVDGHDLEELEAAIRLGRDMRKPVLLHVITTKGKGVPYAEQHPERYHGVGPFEAETGLRPPEKPSFSSAFGQALCELAAEDERIVAITAAMSSGTGLDGFAAAWPQRFFDVGIAEGHGVAMAAAMAKQGLLPVFAVYSSFLQRGYDMLIHDVAIQRLHAVFCVDRAGLVGSDGETHNGCFDVDYLSSVPGMTILCPADFAELRAMLGKALFTLDGPVALRYPRGGEGRYREAHTEAETVLREGADLTVVCYGTEVNEALDACEKLEKEGVSAELIKLGAICPNDFTKTLSSLSKTGRLLCAEDVCAPGCVGERILAGCAAKGVILKGSRLLNVGSGLVAQGTVPELLHRYRLDGDGIAAEALALLRGEADA